MAVRKEMLPTERVALVVYLLADKPGRKFTTAELAKRVDINHGSMWAMLTKLSRRLPIVQDRDGWYVMPKG